MTKKKKGKDPKLAPSSVDRHADDPVGLRIKTCDAGWIFFTIKSLIRPGMRIGATHLEDPFPDLIGWLEAIAGGANCASWAIAEEGSSARLVFVAEHSGWLGGGSDRLIYIGDGNVLFGFAQAAVTRAGLVREFYQEFRRFVESPAYDPAQWEATPLPEGKGWDNLTEEEEMQYSGWDGTRLRELTSEIVEAFI
jgi:hypothetical protein